jgi:hypothetical protein
MFSLVSRKTEEEKKWKKRFQHQKVHYPTIVCVVFLLCKKQKAKNNIKNKNKKETTK